MKAPQMAHPDFRCARSQSGISTTTTSRPQGGPEVALGCTVQRSSAVLWRERELPVGNRLRLHRRRTSKAVDADWP